ncbi:DNA-(apurinic or apyrimidinic site) lyase chloroplastic, partial [Bienertia sinuspersici]
MGSRRPMKQILSWNCRGLGNIPTVQALRRLVSIENPHIIFLAETKLKAPEMERIKNKINFPGLLAVDCVGNGRKRRGGLALLWRSSLEVCIQSFSQNHIDAKIKDGEREVWRLTGIYGFPEEEHKKRTGQLMESLCDDTNVPWVCAGDFNLMINPNEKKGGDNFNFKEAEIFQKAIDTCALFDLGYIGYDYTWSNNRGGKENIQERLDRFLVNQAWKDLHPGTVVRHLDRRKSDHLPIM